MAEGNTEAIVANDAKNTGDAGETVDITFGLESLRARLLESMKRLTLSASFTTVGLGLNILDESDTTIEVVDHFPPCYKLIPISDATKFVLLPIPISTFQSASTALDLVKSITDCVTKAFRDHIKVVRDPPTEIVSNTTVPKDNTNGVDVSMADGVFSRANQAWREVFKHHTEVRRDGLKISLGVIYPEFLLDIRRRFIEESIESHVSLMNSAVYRAHRRRFISFCRRRGLILQHSEPELPDIACVALLQHRSEELPRLIERFPLSNFISVVGCMSFTQMQAKMTIPPTDLSSSLNISSARSSVIKDLMSMPLTSEAQGDFEKIFYTLLNPSQVIIDFDTSSLNNTSPKLRVFAVLICKLLFTCSRTFSNISEDQAQLLDEYLIDNMHSFNLTATPGTRTGMTYKGRVNNDSLSLATNIDEGAGWLNHQCPAETRIESPLYHDVVNAPVYGMERPYISAEAQITNDELIAVLPPMWHIIFRICTTIATFERENFAAFLSAYQERYATYLLRLSSFARSFYEHGLRLPTRVICRLREQPGGLHGPPIRMTIALKSVFLFFLHIPSQFASMYNVPNQLSIESDMLVQISMLIEMFRQHRAMINRLDLSRIISLRDSFKIVTSELKGGLTAYLRLAISQDYVNFLNAFENIADATYSTPHSVSYAAMFANFFNTPEWFGATNNVAYTLQPYDMPSRSRETRIAQGIILTNEYVGPSTRMPMAQWQTHLSRGDLLFTLYAERNAARKIVLDWYIPREIVVSDKVVKTPDPFTIMPNSDNSSETSITFNKFVEFHVMGGDVEPCQDVWLLNDNIHKFQIVHGVPTLQLRESGSLNDMVRRVDNYFAKHVEFTRFLTHLEKMFKP